MNKHTPEPWVEGDDHRRATHPRLLHPNMAVCKPVRPMSDEDYERACVCVSACTGMADPAAEIARLRECDKALKILRDASWNTKPK